MQRILSLPILAILAVALSTMIVNGTPEIYRRQVTPATTTTTTTDVKPTDSKAASNATTGTLAGPMGATAATAGNHTTSSVGSDKATNTTKAAPPAGAKHSSVGQSSSNAAVTFAVASISLSAALFA